MKYLVWSVAVILFLALVNAVASWLGFDVASGGEEAHDAPAAPAQAHAPPHGAHH